MASVTTIRARQGDSVDALCYRYYGSTQGTVEAVLEANPGLADLGAILPIDTEVIMPAASAATRSQTSSATINIWE